MSPLIQSTSYLQLPTAFYQEIAPTPVSNPCLIKINQELLALLGGNNGSDEEALAIYAGNKIPSHLKTIALAYAGHQFGHYVPLLGDGRAVLLGEILGTDGRVWDIQLKGSGKTAFSRGGDGRAPLSAVLREYLISEAMYGLNIPTTRCLAAVACDEIIYRQTGPVPAGVLTRIASSSLREGSFEYAAYQDRGLLKSLANYAIARHFPELASSESPYLELFKAVMERQASLMAQWMGVGFIHGVMNTDNMTISGETIDYGPCAFMDEFDMGTVFSSIDRAGRYAFGNQASIAKWNLLQFSQTLLPLLNEEEKEQLQELLQSFAARFYHYWHQKSRKKLGLVDETEQSVELVNNFFALLQNYKPDFTNTFRLLSKAIDSELQQQQLLDVFGNQEQSKQWLKHWLAYVKQQHAGVKEICNLMDSVNPAYIPRNHLVEKAITEVVENGNNSLMNRLLSVLRIPYQQQSDTQDLQSLPEPHERVLQTFCGT